MAIEVTKTKPQNKVIVKKSGITVVSRGVQGPAGPQGAQGETGPQGEQGESGLSGGVLDDVSDVDLTGLANNDIIQYNSLLSVWENKAQETIVDGGNF